MNGGDGKPPIFILGVPRSGTTLLRTILDSHPAIACGPETPWLGGHQPRSVMELWRFLRDDKHGVVASYGLSPDSVSAAARDFVNRLLGEYARSKGKSRWAEKTPDNALYVDFLFELFPDARFVHLVRDGLDVAVSTSIVEDHRRGISSFLERHLGFGPGVPAVENSPFSALLRWGHWNRLIERSLAGREHFRLSYERLVTEPEPTVRALMDFVGEPFAPAMLHYQQFGHDYPDWEWGSADVRARAGITGARIGRGQRELSPAQRAILEPMARAAAGQPPAHLPSDWNQDHERTLTAFIAGFARPMGLAHDAPSLHAAAAEWRQLMTAGASQLTYRQSSAPIAWIAGLLGHRVRIGADRAPDPRFIDLRDRLRLNLNWDEPQPDRPAKDAAPETILPPRTTAPTA